MKFIAKHLNLLGFFLLAAFVATAAGMYFNMPARLAGNGTAQTDANYACPMHPEIVSAQTGKCSECGMALRLATEVKSTDPACAPHAAATGCDHAELGAGGGCCSKPAPSTQAATAGGCTRLILPPTSASAE